MNLIKQKGMGLIEVMVAFIIIATSAVALVGLQNRFLQTEDESTSREVAMHLAETTLDELRTFDSINTTAGIVAYEDIVSNSTGTSQTIGKFIYTTTWAVTNRFFTTPTPTLPDQKDVNVIVTWLDREGTARSISLFGVISPNTSINASSGLASGSAAAGLKPKVIYTPGDAPDVISVALGNGSIQETTKPLPTVENKEGSIQTQFETITYDSDSTTQVKSDFKTISCSCTTNGTGSALLPAYPYITGSNYIYWNVGRLSDKKNIGEVADDKQPDLCNICCINHFDGDTASFTDYFNQLNKNAKKYNYTWNSDSDVVSSGTYIDSCRLLRLDGYYKPMPDWNLIKMVVMSSSFLSDANNVAIYQNYIKEVVKQYINSLKNDAPFSPPEFSTYAGGDGTNIYMKVGDTPIQLIARGIFVDILSPSSTSYSNPSQLNLTDVETDDPDFLTKVPFYDINMTLLSQWTSGNALLATVSNESIKSLSSTDSNYYGVYRRGYVTPLTMTTNTGIAITASAYQGNSSVAAYQYSSSLPEKAVSPFDKNNEKTGSLNVVIGNSNDPSKASIIGKIYCYDQVTTGNGKNVKISIVDCKQSNINKLTEIAISGTGAACQLEAVKNETSYLLYNCQVTPEVAATVTITAVPSGFIKTPTSVDLIYHTATPNTDGGCFNVYNQNISLSSVPQTCSHNP